MILVFSIRSFGTDRELRRRAVMEGVVESDGERIYSKLNSRCFVSVHANASRKRGTLLLYDS